jgi:hypothetical protein
VKALRLEIKDLQKEFDVTEDNIKALQSVGQIIGEVLKQLDDERCMPSGTFLRGKIKSNDHTLPVLMPFVQLS